MLEDPCDGPTSLVLTNPLSDISFTITDAKKEVTMSDKFTITPSFCKFNVEAEISKLPGKQKPIKEKAEDDLVRIKYNNDLDIVG